MTGQSADRLRAKLSRTREPLHLYQTETLYHVQIDWTCQLLDVVDEVADEVTATMITDVIHERLTGDGASTAAERIRDTRAQMDQLAQEAVAPLETSADWAGPIHWLDTASGTKRPTEER